MSYNTFRTSDNVNKDIFSKYKVSEYGRFDIDATISIQNIGFKYKQSSNVILNGRIKTGGQFMDSCESKLGMDEDVATKHDHEHNTIYMQQILNKLEKMQVQLDRIENRGINGGSDKNNGQSKLEEWILNIFINGNGEIGKEYVQMIVENEGFDDIDIL